MKLPEPIGHLDGTDDLAEFMSIGLRQSHEHRNSSTPRAYTHSVFTESQMRQAIKDATESQAAEIERLESEVVNTKQHLGLSHVALTLATQEANKYSYLREHHAKAILGSCFWFHATGDGQDDLDKLVSDAMGYTK